MQFYQVQLSAVPFVLAKTILGKAGAKVAHNRVPGHFGDHARCGNAEAVAIAVDDRGLGEGEWKYREAVDEDVLGLKRETGQGEPHRLVGRAEDVYRVDLDGINDSDRPADRLVRDDILVNFLALLRQKLLRIVQLFVPEFFRENNCRGYDWTRERAAPRFVDAGDGRDPERAKFSFMPESAAAIHRFTS
jgi:hypothetical protein